MFILETSPNPETKTLDKFDKIKQINKAFCPFSLVLYNYDKYIQYKRDGKPVRPI